MFISNQKNKKPLHLNYVLAQCLNLMVGTIHLLQLLINRILISILINQSRHFRHIRLIKNHAITG